MDLGTAIIKKVAEPWVGLLLDTYIAEIKFFTASKTKTFDGSEGTRVAFNVDPVGLGIIEPLRTQLILLLQKAFKESEIGKVYGKTWDEYLASGGKEYSEEEIRSGIAKFDPPNVGNFTPNGN